MPYWRLFYHIVWVTKGRLAVLDEADTRIVQRSIRTTMESFRAIPRSIGVMPDHVHVAVSIPPSAALSDVVGRMKGATAHALNHEVTRADAATFSWQSEYGIFSFSEKALPPWSTTYTTKKNDTNPTSFGKLSKTRANLNSLLQQAYWSERGVFRPAR